jgi:predicted polyphosphate/ATP-dependent NAD kinase
MDLRVGLIVNPFAGLGGPAALRGSDGVADEAIRRGSVPQAVHRAVEALRTLRPLSDSLVLLTGSGALGAEAAAAAQLPYSVVYEGGSPTTAADTAALATTLAGMKPDLLLFAGGDGTARDIVARLAEPLPALGIPAGVKMYSGVFATTPQAAGNLALQFLRSAARRTRQVEVMDVDEARLRQDEIAPEFFGCMDSPEDARLLQGKKLRSSPGESVHAEAIAEFIVETMDSDGLYLVGPGSTTWSLKQKLSRQGSMLGVDVYHGRKLIARDATAAELECITAHQKARALVTCIGGQGHVFGRGNQQFSARVLTALGLERVTVLATSHKIATLKGRPFIADVGDARAAACMTGFVRVVTGYRSESYYRCEAV